MNEKELRLIRARKKKLFRRLAGAVIAVVILGGLFFWFTLYLSNRERNLPGVFYPAVGREHIPLGATPPKPYNSNPPSSGAHFDSPANQGVYDFEVPDQVFIHNLEHGGVWIAYKPNLPPKAVDELKAIYNEFGGSKIVMAPRSLNDTDIAIVAWTRVLKFNLAGGEFSRADKENIKKFYQSFVNHGPEFVPVMTGIDPRAFVR